MIQAGVMKLHTGTLWSLGSFLLLTLSLFIFVFLVRDFSVTVSSVIAGMVLTAGVIAMVYVTTKLDE